MLPTAVTWSIHAASRAEERGAVTPPRDRIARLGNRLAIGEEFHVKEFLWTWVCKRIGVATIHIITVFPNDGVDKAPKQRRLELKRERRIARKTKERAKWN